MGPNIRGAEAQTHDANFIKLQNSQRCRVLEFRGLGFSGSFNCNIRVGFRVLGFGVSGSSLGSRVLVLGLLGGGFSVQALGFRGCRGTSHKIRQDQHDKLSAKQWRSLGDWGMQGMPWL